jgi:hypothetical protein
MKSFNTPVLFIIFNRLSTTQLVLKKLGEIQPTQLYIAADGPRIDKPGEIEECEAVREFVTNSIDWPCEVKTLFRDENLGCGRGVSSAIAWFFQHVEEGIILEDDCLPDLSFFSYCQELLEKYRNNSIITIISGFNELGIYNKTDSDYIFTKYAGIWGWASWRRAWDLFNYEALDWLDKEKQKKVLTSNIYKHELETNMNNFFDFNRNLSFWGYQWWFYRLLSDTVGIVPSKNLVQNVGFGENATHTGDINSVLASLQTYNISFPLKHPKGIREDSDFEKQLIKLQHKMYGMKKVTLIKQLKGKIKRLIS